MARTAGAVAMGLAVAVIGCDTTVDSSGGGGKGGGGSSSTGDGGWANQVVSTYGTAAGAAPTVSCNDTGLCGNFETGCTYCVVLGDKFTTTDGGACSAFGGCIPLGGDCARSNDPACCSLSACRDACPTDDPSTPANEYLDCLCANDGATCDVAQPAGTCVGDNPDGVQKLQELDDCIAAHCPVCD